MNVVDRIAIGQDRLIIILEIGDKYYLTSVTGQSIQILKELEKSDLIENRKEKKKMVQSNNFKATFQTLLASKKKEND